MSKNDPGRTKTPVRNDPRGETYQRSTYSESGCLRYDHYGRSKVVANLVACPFCGYEFAGNEKREVHLGEHTPEDAGLSPLGVIPEEHDKPLFETEEKIEEIAAEEPIGYGGWGGGVP